MSLSHLVLAILALLIAGTLLTLKAEETRRIDPECGHEYRTELCNGYLYAKYNNVKKYSVKFDHNVVCETICMFHSIAYLRYMLLNRVKGSIVNNKFRSVFF